MALLGMDLIFAEILPKLPIKSLIRFKCVSKSFKSAISSQHFSQLFLRHHLSLSSDNLLILPGKTRINCYNLDSHSLSTATTTFTLYYGASISIVGSSIGSLCILIRHEINYVLVLNPTTRIFKYIDFPVDEKRGFNLGFGFDHETLDYKLVVVSDHHNKAAIKTRITRVYSLNHNSWRIIQTELPTDTMEERHGGVLINNNLLHWMFWSPSLKKRRIGCFNVCTNNWTDDVLLPRYYYDPTHKNYLLEFGVFDERLFSSFENCVDSRFDVWVMKEYGVEDSWVKLLSIPNLNDMSGGVVPVFNRGGSEEVLIRQRHSNRLYWYTRRDGGMTEATFHGAPDFSGLQVYVCWKSFVELPNGKLFRYS